MAKKIKYFLILLTVIFVLPYKVFAIDLVNINTASLEQLDKIVSVGPAVAQKIIDARPFASVDDLLKVKGIGPKTLQKIKAQGTACVNCTTQVLTENVVSTQTKPKTAVPTESKTVTEIKQVVETKVYADGVIINEVFPSPEGADEENEFIEIYNTNNFDVDLSGWKIKDEIGTVVTFIIPNNTKILANNFLLFKRPETKISMNNSGDTISLIMPDNKVSSTVTFEKSLLGQSYNLTSSGAFVWSDKVTPLAKNIISQPVAKNITTKPKTITKDTANTNENLASLAESIDTGQNNDINSSSPYFLFFGVLAIAIVLSAIFMLAKFKFFKKEEIDL